MVGLISVIFVMRLGSEAFTLNALLPLGAVAC